MTRILTVAIIISIAASVTAFAAGSNPPADLIQLEREVSLKMAHARDEGYTDDSRRKTLAAVQAADAEGEQAIKDGQFERAENDFLKAKVLLRDLGI